MAHNDLSYRCYILPIIAAILYYILSLPIVVVVFSDWIPDQQYATFTKSLILLVLLFLSCRILDLFCGTDCHDQQYTNCTTKVVVDDMQITINKSQIVDESQLVLYEQQIVLDEHLIVDESEVVLDEREIVDKSQLVSDESQLGSDESQLGSDRSLTTCITN